MKNLLLVLLLVGCASPTEPMSQVYMLRGIETSDGPILNGYGSLVMAGGRYGMSFGYPDGEDRVSGADIGTYVEGETIRFQSDGGWTFEGVVMEGSLLLEYGGLRLAWGQ